MANIADQEMVGGVPLRKRIWGWYFFDWASQPFHTLLVTFVFGPYFAAVATDYYLASGLGEDAAKVQAQSVWALCLTIAGLIIGFGAPLMGALADSSGRRIPWIFAFSCLYVIGAGSLWFTMPDGSNLWLMLAAFAVEFIWAEYALIFINSQLPSLGTVEEVGSISGLGFAFGYAGGIVALVSMHLLFADNYNGTVVV